MSLLQKVKYSLPEKQSRSRSLLRGLKSGLPDVEALAVVTVDGLVIASLLMPGMNEDRLAAMCASLLALANAASQEVDRGELKQLIVDGIDGPMLLTYAGKNAVLTVAASPKANLGHLLISTRRLALELELLLSDGVSSNG